MRLGIEIGLDRPWAKSTLKVFRAAGSCTTISVFESSLRLARESGYLGLRMARHDEYPGAGRVRGHLQLAADGSSCRGEPRSWAKARGYEHAESQAIDWSDRKARY